ncbi:MAG: cell division topological specificity factor MinE [Hyphomicrobiales bacterium]|jgi:cell division topological specificity factor|nr:cell division topological specificity factor MinE [Hyphomicrobiales bacterium]
MNIFNFFRRGATAPLARERLQILLTHERQSSCSPQLIAMIHKEVLAAIAKHIAIDPDKVDIDIRHKDKVSLLEINLEIPASVSEAADKKAA